MKRFLLSIFFLFSTNFLQADDPVEKGLITRVYADPYVEQVRQYPSVQTLGSLDASFGVNGGRDLTQVFGAGTQAQVIRLLANGSFVIAVNDLSNYVPQIILVKFNQDGNVDTSFGLDGYAYLAQQNLNDMYFDIQNRIICVGGQDDGESWIARFTFDGFLDEEDFALDGVSVGQAEHGFLVVKEQQSGRLIAGGKNENGGVIFAFRADGLVDQSFNPTLSYGSRGFIQIDGAQDIYDLVIDPVTDAIYAVYMDNLNRANVVKIKPDGSGIDTSFVIADEDKMINIADSSQVRLGIGKNLYIIVCAVTNSNNFVVRRYLPNGSVDTDFNGAEIIEIAGQPDTILTHIVITKNSQICIFGVANSEDNQLFVTRITHYGAVDTNFSQTGYLPYYLDDQAVVRQVRFGAIHPTGKLLLTGYEADAPFVVSVIGDRYVPEYQQAPGATGAGILDATFRNGLDAFVMLNDIEGLDDLSAATTPKILHTFADGGYLIILDENKYTHLIKLTALLELDENFNNGNVLSLQTGQHATRTSDLAFDDHSNTVDTLQHFYIAGTDTENDVPWVYHILNDGQVDENFEFERPTGMYSLVSVAQQKFGRIICCGLGGDEVVISGHDIYGNLDTGFGSGTGIFSFAASDVYGCVIDEQDKIVVVFKDLAGYVQIAKLNHSGLGYDASFNNRTINLFYQPDQLKIALDNAGDVIVACVINENYHVARYSIENGMIDVSFNNGFAYLSFGFEESLGYPRLGTIAGVSDGQILVAGYNDQAGDYRGIYAKLLANGQLDTNFNETGILEIYDADKDLTYVDLSVYPDRRTVLLGKDQIINAILLTRVFGDDQDYVSVLDDQPESGLDGAADVSLLNTGYVDLTSFVGSAQAKIVRALDAGKLLVAVDTGTQTLVCRLTTESTLDTSFGGGEVPTGITTTACPSGVEDMYVISNGKILLVGNQDEHVWVAQYNEDGSRDTTFGAYGLVTIYPVAPYSEVYAYQIKVQQNNRIILVGTLDFEVGVIHALNTSGNRDTTFAQGVGTVLVSDTTIIENFVIDDQDRIGVAYLDEDYNAVVALYRSNGAGLEYSFGVNGKISNAVFDMVNNHDNLLICLDQDENILLAAVNEETDIIVVCYDANGNLVETFGQTSEGVTIVEHMHVDLADFLIGRSREAGYDRIMAVVGYQANSEENPMYILWLDENGHIKTNYNQTEFDAGDPGSVQFDIYEDSIANLLTSGVILADGRIVVSGYEYDDESVSYPLLMRRYSHRYGGQKKQCPILGLPGTFDPSFDNDGILVTPFTSGEVNQYATAIYSLDNGFFLVGGYGTTEDDETNWHFMISKIASDALVDQEFGVDGVVVDELSFDGYSDVLKDLVVDYLGRIITVGYCDNGKALIRRYDENGQLDLTFGDWSDNLDSRTGTSTFANACFYAVSMQLNGRLIAIGEDNDSHVGLMVAFDLDGQVDTTFGEYGVVRFTQTHSLHSLVIDEEDSILVSYKNLLGGCNITKVQHNGKPYTLNQEDYYFGVKGTVVDAFNADVYSSSMTTIALDDEGRIIIAASDVNINRFLVRRFLVSGDVDEDFNEDGTALVVSLTQDTDAQVYVQRLIANHDGKYAVIGYQVYDLENAHPFVAQLEDEGTLDLEFYAEGEQQGIHILDIPGGQGIQILRSGVYSAEGKIVSVGYQINDGGLAEPIATVLFASPYSDEVDRIPSYVGLGDFDPTFDEDGFVLNYANDEGGSDSNQEYRAVRQLADLKLMTIISDQTSSWTLKIKADGSVDGSYGNGQGIIIPQWSGSEVVHNMQLDSFDGMMIVGTHSTKGGYLKRLKSDGSVNRLFGGNNRDPLGTVYNILSQAYSVAQLSNGNMIVSGSQGSAGKIVMYDGTSDRVPTFSYQSGINIPSVVVDAQDNIYAAVVSQGNDAYNVAIVKMNSQGVVDSNFGIVENALENLDTAENVMLALDKDNKVVICSTRGESIGNVVLARYTQAGIIDPLFHQGEELTINFATQTGVVATRIIPLSNGKIVVSGYQDGGDSVTNDDQWFVALVRHSGNLDESFNTDGQIPGLLSFQFNEDLHITRYNHDSIVQSDGKIVLAGGESPSTDASDPILVRIIGNEDVQEVAQFPGVIQDLPNPTYPHFGDEGLAESTAIEYLVDGGNILLDSQGRTYVGGFTQNGKLVVTRFLADGSVDRDYGTDGVASTPTILNLERGGAIVLDGNEKIVIGGLNLIDSTLVTARFTTSGVADTTYSDDGVVQTPGITNLISGGYVAVDSHNKVVVSGLIGNGKVCVAMFTRFGDLDEDFGVDGIKLSDQVEGLTHGGSILIDVLDRIFIAGYQATGDYTGALLVFAFDEDGDINTDYGYDGIATTGDVDNLLGVGSMDFARPYILDGLAGIVIGGHASDDTFVVARFNRAGTLDDSFNGTGIQVSAPITGLYEGGYIVVDDLDRTVVGGLVLSTTGNSMVVARFLSGGSVDEDFVDGGIGTTEIISDLVHGGFVAVDALDRILCGGMVDDGNGYLIAHKLYSGDEVILALIDRFAQNFKIKFLNQERFLRMLNIDYYLNEISATATDSLRVLVLGRIVSVLNDYIGIYGSEEGFHLIGNLAKLSLIIDDVSEVLMDEYSGSSATQVRLLNFFGRLSVRLNRLLRAFQTGDARPSVV